MILPPDLLLALVGFAFATSITPGPNNVMLLASGANFGVRRTIPHVLGISLGHAFMVTLVGIGLMGALDRYPAAHHALRIASVLYMLWLAWKIATASTLSSDDGAGSKGTSDGRGGVGGTGGGKKTGTPLTFLQAAAFQWVNPKAWAMALGAIAAYAPTRSLGAVVAVALVFALVNLPSVGVWAVLGQSLRTFLADPRRLRTFNVVMAALLVASIAPVLNG